MASPFQYTPLFAGMANPTSFRPRNKFAVNVLEGDVARETQAIGAHHVLERAPFTIEDDPAGHRPVVLGTRRIPPGLPRLLHHSALMESTRSLRDEAELYRRWSATFGHEPDRDLAAENRGLTDAMVARDPELAAERLRQHNAHTAQLLLTIRTRRRPAGQRTAGARGPDSVFARRQGCDQPIEGRPRRRRGRVRVLSQELLDPAA
jgi:hypothetical protein